MNPRIIFQRAPTYEQQLKKIKDYVMPDNSIYEKHIADLKAEWEKWGPKIFDELARITKLDWEEKDIRCYVVSGTFSSFSHPLTLKIYDTTEKMLNVFTHELIHRLLNSPTHPERVKQARKELIEKYKDEQITTKNHIVLYAIHSKLMLTLFGAEKMEKEMASIKKPEFIRAWQIVNEYGQEKILNDIFGTNQV